MSSGRIFDELCLVLATPVSRRIAVRQLAGVIAGGAVTVLWPKQAAANARGSSVLNPEASGVPQAGLPAGQCPSNAFPIRTPHFTVATGCTRQEARDSLDGKLLDFCVKFRADQGQPCEGDCPQQDYVCITLATFEDDKVKYVVAKIPGCKTAVNYLCHYEDSLTCECYCAPRPPE